MSLSFSSRRGRFECRLTAAGWYAVDVTRQGESPPFRRSKPPSRIRLTRRLFLGPQVRMIGCSCAARGFHSCLVLDEIAEPLDCLVPPVGDEVEGPTCLDEALRLNLPDLLSTVAAAANETGSGENV
jgi:hypothetical protein